VPRRARSRLGRPVRPRAPARAGRPRRAACEIRAVDEAHRHVQQSPAARRRGRPGRCWGGRARPRVGIRARRGPENGIAREPRIDQLERHAPVECQVGGAEDRRHPAAAGQDSIRWPANVAPTSSSEGAAAVLPGPRRGRRQTGAQRRVEIRAPGRGRSHRRDELRLRSGLQYIRARSCSQRFTREAEVVLHRNHDERGARGGGESWQRAQGRVPGMLRSSTTIRDRCSSTCRSAVSASAASATTWRSPSASSSRRRPARTIAWSSASTISIASDTDIGRVRHGDGL
jgi:hypothetical protein